MLHPGLIVGIVDHYPLDKVEHILWCLEKLIEPKRKLDDKEKSDIVSRTPDTFFNRFCTYFDGIFLGVYINSKKIKYYPVAVIYWPFQKGCILEIPICNLTRLGPLEEVCSVLFYCN